MNHDTTLENYAEQLAGNHRTFDSFAWFDRPEDDEKWCLVYWSNRDSNCLERSNAKIIEDTLESYESNGTVRLERHNHWAVGYVDGASIRVYGDQGEITEAFRAYFDLVKRIESYPVLDETLFYEMEQTEAEETWSNCFNEAERVEYIRAHRDQFDFRNFADLRSVVRGDYFNGYAAELIQP